MSRVPVNHVNVTLFSRFNHFWTTFGTSLLQISHRNKHLHLAKLATAYNIVFILTFFQLREERRYMKFAGTKNYSSIFSAGLNGRVNFFASFASCQYGCSTMGSSVLRTPRHKPFLLPIWWRPLPCLGWGAFVCNSLVGPHFCNRLNLWPIWILNYGWIDLGMARS